MKFFEASFTAVIYRYYLMMAIVIISVLSGATLLSLLALPIFLSAILAPTFDFGIKKAGQEAPEENRANKQPLHMASTFNLT